MILLIAHSSGNALLLIDMKFHYCHTLTTCCDHLAPTDPTLPDPPLLQETSSEPCTSQRRTARWTPCACRRRSSPTTRPTFACAANFCSARSSTRCGQSSCRFHSLLSEQEQRQSGDKCSPAASVAMAMAASWLRRNTRSV